MRNTFINNLVERARLDDSIILIVGDLGFNVVEPFQSEFPKRFINAGICEQNMASMAAGLASEGFKVFVYSIANFPTFRCAEQIRNDICYHDLDVTIVSIGGGFSYGQLGMSHHATEDISILRAIPNLTVNVPSTLSEVRGAVRQIASVSKPNYLRLDKSFVDLKTIQEYVFGKATLLEEGSDVTIIVAGGILEEVLDCSKKLRELDDINCRILSMHTVKPIDKEAIIKSCEETKAIITVEENNIVGGLGSAVAEVIQSSGTKKICFKMIGLQDRFSSIVGDQKYLREKYEISSNHIYSSVKKIIQNI